MTPERALQLISKYGAPFVMKRKIDGDYDPDSSEVRDGGSNSYSTFAADWEYRISDIDGSLVQQGDLRLLVARIDGMPDPAPPDLGLYASACYRVITCKPIRQAGEAVCYDVQLRR